MRFGFAFVLVLAGCATSSGIDGSKLVDLTHPFNSQTVYWPTARRFELTRLAHGKDATGEWYASSEFCASEHGGTHLDAPIHFAEGMRSTDAIPLHQLVGPARVIDVRPQCAANPDYEVTPADISGNEAEYGRIMPGTIVLFRTGFGAFYPDARRYLGSDVRGRVDDLHFPGIGEAAARVLVERRVDAVGIDTASLDPGPSKSFVAHRILLGANIPGLENVAHLEALPPTGATVLALPMKIEGGTGGPCRIVAVLP